MQAEGEYNNGKYTASLNTLVTINTAYLSTEQMQKYNSLKDNIEAKKKGSEGISESQAINIALNRFPNHKVVLIRTTTYPGTLGCFVLELEGLIPGAYEKNEKTVTVDRSTGAIIHIAG